jgi:hypothetical protein
MKRKPLYISAVGGIVACLFAAATVAPASAAEPGLLTPSPKHVNCGAWPVTEPPLFACAEVSFANNTTIDLTIIAIETVDRDANISPDFFAQPTGANGCTQGRELSPFENCQLFVYFDPSQTGHRSARLNVFDDVSLKAARIRLGGRGTE